MIVISIPFCLQQLNKFIWLGLIQNTLFKSHYQI